MRTPVFRGGALDFACYNRAPRTGSNANMAGGNLNGKSLVIIGGTTGLGLSAARAFVRQGARVVVVGRKRANVEAAQTELGAMAKALRGDASEPATAPRAI